MGNGGAIGGAAVFRNSALASTYPCQSTIISATSTDQSFGPFARGTFVSISASGLVALAADGAYKTDANGVIVEPPPVNSAAYDFFTNLAAPAGVAPVMGAQKFSLQGALTNDAPFGALVGAWTSSSSPAAPAWFRLGSFNSMLAPNFADGSARLLLAVNDNTPFDNLGAFPVTITNSVCATPSLLKATPASVLFSYEADTATPAAQTVSIDAATPTSFTVGATSVSWLTAGANALTTPAQLTLTPRAGMAQGYYSGYLDLLPVGGGRALSIPVSLDVLPSQPKISCAPDTGPTVTKTEYQTTCTVTGGTPGYRWSIASGTLPSGLNVLASSGVSTTIFGTPAVAGPYRFSLGVTDAHGLTATRQFRGTLGPAAGPALFRS